MTGGFGNGSGLESPFCSACVPLPPHRLQRPLSTWRRDRFSRGEMMSGFRETEGPFSLADDLGAETTGYLRIRFNQTFAGAHVLSLLYAPLVIESTGSIPEEVVYNGGTFPANTRLTGTYQFIRTDSPTGTFW